MALAIIPGAMLMSFASARRIRPIYRTVRKDVEQPLTFTLTREEINVKSVRAKAIEGMGVFGGKQGSRELVALYGSEKNLDLRKKIVESLMINGDADALVKMSDKTGMALRVSSAFSSLQTV